MDFSRPEAVVRTRASFMRAALVACRSRATGVASGGALRCSRPGYVRCRAAIFSRFLKGALGEDPFFEAFLVATPVQVLWGASYGPHGAPAAVLSRQRPWMTVDHQVSQAWLLPCRAHASARWPSWHDFGASDDQHEERFYWTCPLAWMMSALPAGESQPTSACSCRKRGGQSPTQP